MQWVSDLTEFVFNKMLDISKPNEFPMSFLPSILFVKDNTCHKHPLLHCLQQEWVNYWQCNETMTIILIQLFVILILLASFLTRSSKLHLLLALCAWVYVCVLEKDWKRERERGQAAHIKSQDVKNANYISF